MTTLIIDESGDDLGSAHRYVIGAGVLVGNDDNLDDVREAIRGLFAAVPGRTRPFHWVTEGVTMRRAVIELIGTLPVEAYAVIGSADSPHHLELTRDRCLRELFRTVRGHDLAARDDREPRAFDDGRGPEPARLRNDDRGQARGRTAAVGAVRVGTQGRAAGVARRRAGRCRARSRARGHDLARRVGRSHENEPRPTSALTRMSPGSRNHLDGVAGSSGALLRRAQDARGKSIMPVSRLVDKSLLAGEMRRPGSCLRAGNRAHFLQRSPRRFRSPILSNEPTSDRSDTR